MSTLMHAYDAELAALLAVGDKLAGDGPTWLREQRVQALRIVREHGIPTPKNEEWKYTPLKPVADTDWQQAEPGPAIFNFTLPFCVEGSARIVLVNGRFDANLSDIPKVKGLTIESMFSALALDNKIVAEHLGQIVEPEKNPLAALNTALFRDGLFIHIAAGAMVEPVIEIVHVVTGEGTCSAPRLLVVAEEGAVAKIVERWISETDEKTLNIPVTESFIARSANIEHVRYQDESPSAINIALWQSRQGEASEYKAYNIAFGGAIARLDQNIFLDGEHVVTRLDGVAVARGTQLIDNHTRLDHALPNGNSYEIYKQIIDDQATIVFNGKIYVYQDAQKTDAEQTNQALLLSPNATINSKPQLEIFADDVKCTHGATVGQIEEAPLFYMMSRGLPREEAEGLLVYAFAAEVLELISIDEVKNQLEERLFEKLR